MYKNKLEKFIVITFGCVLNSKGGEIRHVDYTCMNTISTETGFVNTLGVSILIYTLLEKRS